MTMAVNFEAYERGIFLLGEGCHSDKGGPRNRDLISWTYFARTARCDFQQSWLTAQLARRTGWPGPARSISVMNGLLDGRLIRRYWPTQLPMPVTV
jgi:hypothetical protein